jgi:hypothetical protein
MKIAIIPPTKHLGLTYLGDMAMVLSHLVLQNSDYMYFYRSYSKFKLLDNSAAEMKQVSDEDIITAARLVRADEIVAPDTLYDGHSTWLRTKKFAEMVKARKLPFKVMGVPQGSSMDEWIECYDKMNLCADIDTIGFSKISVPKSFVGAAIFPGADMGEIHVARPCVLQRLYQSGHDPHKPIHMLGMGNPIEMLEYKDDTIVRSIDSCYAVFAAFKGQRFSPRTGCEKRIPTEHAYFDAKLSPLQMARALWNIGVTKMMSRGWSL